jgi:acyl CoA:acetate/3-ketoacid CoA transferase beta subunit
VFVMMRHNDRDGAPKLVPVCTLPLTAAGVVSRVYTELGVFCPTNGTLTVLALAPGCDLDFVRAMTGLPVQPAQDGSPIPVLEAVTT